MPAPYGITATGFNSPTLAEIADEMRARLRTSFGGIDLSDRSVEGQFVLIVAERLLVLWEIAELLWTAMDPDAATGALLEVIALLTGTFRRPAAASTVTLTLCGDPTTAVPTGSRVSVNATLLADPAAPHVPPIGDEFVTTADAVIAALPAWTGTHAYVVGDRVTNTARCYQCSDPGTSAGSGGPILALFGIPETDGGVEWQYIGEGTAATDVAAASSEKAAIVAVAGYLNDILTPVSGWSTAVNLEDASIGRLIDNDATLRIRREFDLFRPGSGTGDQIRDELVNVAGVTAARVFVNNTDDTLLEGGVPTQTPHSIEALVRGGDDQDILDAILRSKAGGIATYSNSVGTVSGTATDSQGEVHALKFTRPADLVIHAKITLQKDPDTYPADGDAQVKTAIAAWGNALGIGRDVYPSAISAQAFQVDGMLAVTEVLLKVGSAPGGGDVGALPATKRDVSTWDVTHIVVVATDGVV